MKIFLNGTLLKFYDNQASQARNKIDASPIKEVTTSKNHPTETYIRDIDLYFFRKVSFKSKENQY